MDGSWCGPCQSMHTMGALTLALHLSWYQIRFTKNNTGVTSSSLGRCCQHRCRGKGVDACKYGLPPQRVQASGTNVQWDEILQHLPALLVQAIHALGNGTIGLGGPGDGIAVERQP